MQVAEVLWVEVEPWHSELVSFLSVPDLVASFALDRQWHSFEKESQTVTPLLRVRSRILTVCPARPQHALFPPSHLHSLLTLSSLLTLLQSLRLPFCSLLLGHLCPGIYYLVHSWSSAGALLRFSVFNEASLTSAILQHLPTPPAGLSLILCHGFFIFIITRDTVSQEYQHKYNNDN